MALESKKIPSFDSEPKTTSNYMLRFFDLPTLFSFYQLKNEKKVKYNTNQKSFPFLNTKNTGDPYEN